MKTRRLCAVIAAAATLLGGMAFGTAGAYAAGSASIEVRHSQKGHTYSAYKFASLTVDGDAVQVDTDADWVTAVTDAVAAANNNMDPVVSMPSEYDSNPAAFAATKTGDNDAAWFRTFAASLAVAPQVVKNTRSIPLIWQSLRASWAWGADNRRLEEWMSCWAWRVIAATSAGWQCPREQTAMPAKRSRYSLPRLSQSVQPAPCTKSAA